MIPSGFIIALVLFGLWLWIGISRFVLTGHPKYEYFLNNDTISRKWLEEHIEKADKEVLVISGTFNPKVYNEIAEILIKKMRLNKTIMIKMLAGPTIFTLDGKNKIFTLAQENPFSDRLLISFLNRRPIQHLRVIDSKSVFLEFSHQPGVENRWAASLENSSFKAWEYRRKFEELWEGGERAREVELVSLEKLDQG